MHGAMQCWPVLAGCPMGQQDVRKRCTARPPAVRSQVPPCPTDRTNAMPRLPGAHPDGVHDLQRGVPLPPAVQHAGLAGAATHALHAGAAHALQAAAAAKGGLALHARHHPTSGTTMMSHPAKRPRHSNDTTPGRTLPSSAPQPAPCPSLPGSWPGGQSGSGSEPPPPQAAPPACPPPLRRATDKQRGGSLEAAAVGTCGRGGARTLAALPAETQLDRHSRRDVQQRMAAPPQRHPAPHSR